MRKTMEITEYQELLTLYNKEIEAFVLREKTLSSKHIRYIDELRIMNIIAIFDSDEKEAIIFRDEERANLFLTRLASFDIYIKTKFPKEFFTIQTMSFINALKEYNVPKSKFTKLLNRRPYLILLFNISIVSNLRNY
jgi:hypothetical protein